MLEILNSVLFNCLVFMPLLELHVVGSEYLGKTEINQRIKVDNILCDCKILLLGFETLQALYLYV